MCSERPISWYITHAFTIHVTALILLKDVWGGYSGTSGVTHYGGNFGRSANTINGWLRDFLWSQSSQVIQSYGSALSAYGLMFLAGHFVWSFSLMFLFSGRGYWQELIESIVWAHVFLARTAA